MDFSAFFQYVDVVTCKYMEFGYFCHFYVILAFDSFSFSVFFELLICLATVGLIPATILASLVGQNIMFWTIVQLARGFNVDTLKERAKHAAGWYWKIFSKVWHGHEIIGEFS